VPFVCGCRVVVKEAEDDIVLFCTNEELLLSDPVSFFEEELLLLASDVELLIALPEDVELVDPDWLELLMIPTTWVSFTFEEFVVGAVELSAVLSLLAFDEELE